MKFIAFLLLFAACSSATSQPVPDWKITAEATKKPMVGYETTMRVNVSDAKGKPVEGATVELVVTMIDMDHGEFKSATTMTAPGVYEGKVNLFMVGAWNLDVRVSRANQSMSKKIRFDVKE